MLICIFLRDIFEFWFEAQLGRLEQQTSCEPWRRPPNRIEGACSWGMSDLDHGEHCRRRPQSWSRSTDGWEASGLGPSTQEWCGRTSSCWRSAWQPRCIEDKLQSSHNNVCGTVKNAVAVVDTTWYEGMDQCFAASVESDRRMDLSCLSW